MFHSAATLVVNHFYPSLILTGKGAYQSGVLKGLHSKAEFPLAKVSAIAPMTSTHESDRIISIFVVPHKVAKASTIVTVACSCCQH
jgi:hypothetical protein